MSHASIAVVIPVYNRREVVVEALESVRQQTHPPQRVVVVDDGSSDGSTERVRQWAAEVDPGVPLEVIEQANQGVSAARNRGVEATRDCGLLAFLDSDDLWPTDYLARMAAAMDDEQVVAASTDRLNTRHGARPRLVSAADMEPNATRRLLEVGPVGTPNTIYRTPLFEAVGGFEVDQYCGEDFQLQLRMSLRGRWRYVPGLPVECRELRSGGEQEAPLSKRYPDRRYRMAMIMDRFLREEGGASALPQRFWRRRLARAWHAAGRQLRQADDLRAAACFDRAIELRPFHWRARWRRWSGR
ncbi:MAG: glycosyltransferase family A protein [Phycisphaeraceae bacterium]